MRTPLLAAAFAACGLVACTSKDRPSSPPQIVFQEITYDFGRAAQGTKIKHAYAFHNAGSLDLSIDNVRTSCDCSVATIASKVIPSGGEGIIDVAFDTAGDSGHRTRTITVYSNDPGHPVTTLSLVGTVDADVAADPPALYVGHLRRGQTAPNEVRLVTADTTTLGAVDNRSKVFDASLHTVAGGTRLRVAIKPDAPSGRFKDTVTIHAKSGRQPVVTIPIVGVIDADGHAAE